MIPLIDIWRAANLLIRKHGVKAGLGVAKRTDTMLDRRGEDGRLLWARIRRTIEALRPTDPSLAPMGRDALASAV
jgi:hypothetical protein